MRNEGIQLELRTSGEVALSRLADLTNEQKRALRLGDGPYLLVESPLAPLAGDFDLLLVTILSRGELVVLAHPERSPLFQQEPERGDFGELVRRFTIELLRDGVAHDLSPDVHDSLLRPPGLADALSYVGVGKRLQAVVDPHPVLLADEWAAMKESGPKPIVRRATGRSPAWRARRSIRRGKYRYETACASLLRSL